MIKRAILILLLFYSHLSQSSNLFNEHDYRPIASDNRAAFLGDLITVLVMETASGETSSNLASSKRVTTELSAAYEKEGFDMSLSLSGKGKTFAKTGRKGQIKAALTVQITGLSPEGRYYVTGKQLISINGEQQIIQLSGLIRKEDISRQNTIPSTRIAQANITYSGQGVVANSQKHNYVYKALSFLGLA